MSAVPPPQHTELDLRRALAVAPRGAAQFEAVRNVIVSWNAGVDVSGLFADMLKVTTTTTTMMTITTTTTTMMMTWFATLFWRARRRPSARRHARRRRRHSGAWRRRWRRRARCRPTRAARRARSGAGARLSDGGARRHAARADVRRDDALRCAELAERLHAAQCDRRVAVGDGRRDERRHCVCAHDVSRRRARVRAARRARSYRAAVARATRCARCTGTRAPWRVARWRADRQTLR